MGGQRISPCPEAKNSASMARVLARIGASSGGTHCESAIRNFSPNMHSVRRLVNFATKIYYGLLQRGHTQPLEKKLNLHILTRTAKRVRLAAVTVQAHSEDRTYVRIEEYATGN